jgi:hypothetical protein
MALHSLLGLCDQADIHEKNNNLQESIELLVKALSLFDEAIKENESSPDSLKVIRKAQERKLRALKLRVA